MSKTVDWNKYAKPPVQPKPAGKYASFKELLQKSQARQSEQEKAERIFKALRPRLNEKLLDYMINRKPIKVIEPITVLVDSLSKSERGGKYNVGYEQIPTNTELTFVNTQKTLGQWIFKSSDGREYEIYDNPVVMISPSETIKNPGLLGLLTKTNIYSEVIKDLTKEDDKRS